MELTLESALSPGGLVGHASYLLLVVSMLMRSMTWLRILVIASAFTAIACDTIWLKDHVGVFWETLLVTVNVIQIEREWLRERRAQFSPEEERFLQSRLGALSRAEARRPLNMGLWVDAEPGVLLTKEETPVDHLGNAPASATAVVSEPARYWLIPSKQIRRLQQTDPEIAAAFQAGMARDLRNKIIAGNEAARAEG